MIDWWDSFGLLVMSIVGYIIGRIHAEEKMKRSQRTGIQNEKV